MKPMGREKMKFPGKCSAWLGKGIKWWWENEATVSKKKDRQKAKQEIRDEIFNKRQNY